jgi:hypothetical protein
MLPASSPATCVPTWAMRGGTAQTVSHSSYIYLNQHPTRPPEQPDAGLVQELCSNNLASSTGAAVPTHPYLLQSLAGAQ